MAKPAIRRGGGRRAAAVGPTFDARVTDLDARVTALAGILEGYRQTFDELRATIEELRQRLTPTHAVAAPAALIGARK